MKRLTLISCPRSLRGEERLLELAQWMGVTTQRVAIGSKPVLDQLANVLAGCGCVALSAQTLAFLAEMLPPQVLETLITTRWERVLVFTATRDGPGTDLPSWLTGGALAGLAPPAAVRDFRFPAGGRALSGVFAGLGFALKSAVTVSGFRLEPGGGTDTQEVLLAGERPVFLSTRRGSCEVLLLSLSDIPAIREPVSQNAGIEEHYDRIIPLLIFLRHCFPDMFWQKAAPTGRLIIDDPLLERSYGFLDFGALAGSMRSARYGTTIAFIPWNYWRTSPRRARPMFTDRSELSLCVHGCDHTNMEFDEIDPGALQWMADTALARMERHQHRTGLSFDAVMVFPQGHFSSAALRALRDSGYLAAVNTTCFPTDAGAAQLTIADFLRPAITRFFGFPLFQRRYPRRLVDFAYDMFIGRPVLLVQHQDDFRDGYRKLEEFVADLYRLDSRLTWPPLADQLMSSCLTRSLPGGSAEVRFFTRRFRFANAGRMPSHVSFSKHEPDASAVASVEIDGSSVPFSVENGLITFTRDLAPGQAFDIRIVAAPVPTGHPVVRRDGLGHTVGVAARRSLSEVRDKLLSRHPRLLAAATGLAARMKATGRSDWEE
ncbi:MAG TPA: hypothetical protein VNK52_00740 [Hyphomicrobiaceae bacterium]|nr:hypothetical protein [Hyphomicrobiaceae bacterium]